MSIRRYRQPGINPIWVLIGVNFLIFLAEQFDSQNLIIARFALFPSEIGSQPWTLVTYMFLHASWLHVIFNMIALYFLGTFTMYVIGETAFLVTYFVGGIVGGLFVLLFAQFFPTGGVVGASGAVFALGGLLMVLRPSIKVIMFPIPVEIPLWIAILINFVFVAVNPGVSWEGHLGGIVYGAAVGYFYRRREFRRY
jgi:membrane associated rhomboid family serine protease